MIQFDEKDYQELDIRAHKYETDKASSGHDYTRAYSILFNSFREKPIKLLEIGIGRASSIRLWEHYFKNAELHFIDLVLDPSLPQGRSRYYQADQSKPEELERVMKTIGGQFDVIIDDGSHQMKDQILSFQTLFPYVKSQGLYIIEDLHTSYMAQFGGGNHGNTTVQFLKNLIDQLNFIGASTWWASYRDIAPQRKAKLPPYSEEILSVTFYGCLAAIVKR